MNNAVCNAVMVTISSPPNRESPGIHLHPQITSGVIHIQSPSGLALHQIKATSVCRNKITIFSVED